MQFILASESARRVALLEQVGYDFEARTSGFPEVTLDDPRETVQANARGKALSVAREAPDRVVLGADTIGLSGTYHRFRSDRLGQDYGDEIDVLASVKVKHATVSARYARYHADAFATDTDKAWLQLSM